jgi:hypothetical protein
LTANGHMPRRAFIREMAEEIRRQRHALSPVLIQHSGTHGFHSS